MGRSKRRFFSSHSMQTTAFRLSVKRTCVSSFSPRSLSSCRALQSFLDCSALCSNSGRGRRRNTQCDKKKKRQGKSQTHAGYAYLASSSPASCSPAQPPPAFLSETWRDGLVNTPLTRTVKCLALEITSGPGKMRHAFFFVNEASFTTPSYPRARYVMLPHKQTHSGRLGPRRPTKLTRYQSTLYYYR